MTKRTYTHTAKSGEPSRSGWPPAFRADKSLRYCNVCGEKIVLAHGEALWFRGETGLAHMRCALEARWGE